MTRNKGSNEDRLAIEVLDDFSSDRGDENPFDDRTNDGFSNVSTSEGTSMNKGSNTKNGQNGRNGQSNQQNDKSQPVLSHQETRNVVRLRRSVVIILVLSAIIAGILSFWYLHRAERLKFEAAYQDYAYKVGQSMYGGIMNTFSSLDLLATIMVTHATSANEEWPYQTVPNFANIVAKMISGSAGITIWSMMLVNGTEQRVQWENYASTKQASHINNTLSMMETDPNYYGTIPYDVPIVKEIHDGNLAPVPYNESRLFAPVWQMYPIQSSGFSAYNWDWYTYIDTNPFISSITTKRAVLGTTYMNPDVSNADEMKEAQYWADTFFGLIDPNDAPLEPASDILYPVINRSDRIKLLDDDHNSSATDSDTRNEVVAVLSSSFYWRDVIKNVLPETSTGLIVVIENPCSASFTYQVNGPKTIYLGRGDLHDSEYDNMAIRVPFYDLDKHSSVTSRYTGVPLSTDSCQFVVTMYPSDKMRSQFISSNPAVFAAVAVLIFVFTTCVFSCYDKQVEQRQRLVMTTAVRTTAVLSSLFPSSVRDKILQQDASTNGFDNGPITEVNKNSSTHAGFTIRDVPSLHNSDHDFNNSTSLQRKFDAPIADLYPETTVFFADICGFTAWSSSRGPDQVFILLESLYYEFDMIARRRKVFKVETIGDSYVAVGGLPDPMKYHATIMVKFSQDILLRMKEVVSDLSSSFGPDTQDLDMRVGLNSGPTTAGVIRGEKSRFQLFGDTVNTASRMESTGSPGKIQCSSKTAELLRKSGKGHWLTQRDDVVKVKGKGDMTTFWVQSASTSAGSIRSSRNEHSNADCNDNTINFGDNESDFLGSNSFMIQKDSRFIDWNFDVFQSLLVDVMSVAHSKTTNNYLKETMDWEAKLLANHANQLPFNEVVEVINIQGSNAWNMDNKQFSLEIVIDQEVAKQLRDFLTAIASTYRSNPFHNFEHGSHVVMSTKNLLDRVATQSNIKYVRQVHLDPIVRFAIVFGALIHDVDHLGVPNSQLTKEQTSTAIRYRNRCVAEQNSFDVAWNLFTLPQYTALRRCLFSTENDWIRFRQVVLNVVMATDIFDEDLMVLRQDRWDKVFGEQGGSSHGSSDDDDRTATVCVEHLIQASDVIHTMQHWHIYQKWNRKLFQEMNIAYQQGRLEKDPKQNWYEGELWFFDNYIIPLANKLKVCGVFGANSAAFLDFACDNRAEWEAKGRNIVNAWITELSADCDAVNVHSNSSLVDI